MRHPFDGIDTPQTSRRSWLAFVAGLFGFASVANAAAPPKTKVKLIDNNVSPEPTTERLGEEGGGTKRRGEDGGPSTEAVGEEGGPRITSLAVGEEGGRIVTTKPDGEEGGKMPMTLAKREEGGGVTSLAVGEEGGKKK